MGPAGIAASGALHNSVDHYRCMQNYKIRESNSRTLTEAFTISQPLHHAEAGGICHCEWVAIDSAVNNFLCLNNLSQGKGWCIRYRKLVSPELADPGIPPPRVKTETFYRKNGSAAVPRASRASAGFSRLVTFSRISFERLLVVYSGLLRPCRE